MFIIPCLSALNYTAPLLCSNQPKMTRDTANTFKSSEWRTSKCKSFVLYYIDIKTQIEFLCIFLWIHKAIAVPLIQDSKVREDITAIYRCSDEDRNCVTT